MNERIKELAVQAEFSENELHIQGDNFQKFAELIVRECMKVSRGADGVDATHEAWYLIKEHFGVEE